MVSWYCALVPIGHGTAPWEWQWRQADCYEVSGRIFTSKDRVSVCTPTVAAKVTDRASDVDCVQEDRDESMYSHTARLLSGSPVSE